MRPSRALSQFPFVAEQVREEVVAPLRRRRGPNDFQAAADRVSAFARAKFALPAETLLFYAGGFWLLAHECRSATDMWFAGHVTDGDDRECLHVLICDT